MPRNILVVDDEESMRSVLSILLRKEGNDVTSCEDGAEAIAALHNSRFDMVITDLKMPGVSGIEVLRSAKSVNPAVPVVMITAFASAESAVEAMKLGASDYITKPFRVDDVRRIVRGCLSGGVASPADSALNEADSSDVSRLIVSDSQSMRDVLSLLPRISASEANVMITGESGTGKELVAKSIHEMSARSGAAFITVNCGAIPENLLESELFGHVKGAFTNAIANKKGLFEMADGGTIFLDEIGDMPQPLQVKLLRVIEDGDFRRVGDAETRRVNARIIAATNKDLKEAIRDGSFREDLFYRLNVLPLKLPPLRNRAGDVPVLVRHFLGRMKPAKRIDPEAMEILSRYPWWGNVRELENMIERLVVMSDGDVVLPRHIPDEIRMPESLPLPQEIPPGGVNLEGIIEDIEKRYLVKALEKAKGVKTDAAKLLNLTFRSFRHRLAKYQLGKPDDEGE